MRNLFHISIQLFAQIGDDVRIADLQRQKRIRCVLDQFRAVDRSNQKLRFGFRRAAILVHRAAEFTLQDRLVNAAHGLSRGFVVHAHHDAVGMEKIENRRAFPQELGIGHHGEAFASAA